jgi:hypothetical protein
MDRARCLLLALIYPIVTIFLIWAVSGHVGPAEAALGSTSDLPGWRRTLSFGRLKTAVDHGLSGSHSREKRRSDGSRSVRPCRWMDRTPDGAPQCAIR